MTAVKYKTPENDARKTELYHTSAKVKEIEADIKSSPVRRFLPLVMKSGGFRGEIKTLTKKQYKNYMLKDAKPAIIDKKGRIPWHYAFDELASESGYKSDEDFKEAIEKLSDQVAELRKFKTDKSSLKADIVKGEYTKPEPETVKRTSMEPPVFDKEKTRAEKLLKSEGLKLLADGIPRFGKPR